MINVKVLKKHIFILKVILNEEREEYFTTVPKLPETEAQLNALQLVASVRRLVIGQISFLPEVPH